MKELTRAVTELGLCSVLVNGYSNLGADKLYLDEDRFMRAIKHARRRIAALAGRDGQLRARQRRNHHGQRAQARHRPGPRGLGRQFQFGHRPAFLGV